MKKPANTRIHPLIILFSILILSFSACSSAAKPPEAVSESARAPAVEAPAGAPAPSLADSAGGSAKTSNSFSQPSDSAQADNRLVIKNANLTIVVDDPSKAMDNISKMAESLGGYVVAANLSYDRLDSGTEVPKASSTIRVPAQKLEEALASIQGESQRDPLNKSVQSQDVTKEYTDLQSRLRNLQAAEAQLQEIMGSAVKTEDVLNVYNQLTQVRGEIEVIKGQIQYYEQSAAFSEISTSILANAAVQPLTIGGWQPVGVAKQAIQALIYAVKFLVNAAIWIVLFVLPVGLLIVLPLYVLYRLVRRWLASRRKPVPPAQPAS